MESNTALVGYNRDTLLEFFNKLHPLKEDVVSFARKETFTITIKRNELLDAVNHYKDCLFFVIKGFIRGYIVEDEKEITTSLNGEKCLVGKVRNPLIVKSPYTEHLQALEDTELLVAPYHLIDGLYTHFPETNVLGRKLLAIHYQRSSERSILSRIPTAEARYKQFVINHPDISKRVSVKILSSYLCMRLETLSRMRSKIKKDI
ncbi:Crp/Fnr family transcriptional regulator [Pedobacter nototheniae]|uniref:Crp/Fnr family transcriptional regulator n=1 Tax=Pedobacter nototheniae TaxID=2488994 RepID=UPI0029308F5E|nr:Crp/Fnr family transcriptional regulator [Pedobacter nototheniae]